MQFRYETDRLILKLLNEDDSLNVLNFLIENKEYFEPYEPEQVEQYYTDKYQSLVLQWELKKFLKLRHIRYYVFLKTEPQQIIGTISFTHILSSPYKSCVAGYKFDHRYRGYGYASEAFSKCMEAVFCDLEIHRIEAYIMPRNFPSIKFIEKNGFIREGTLKQMIEVQGEWEDHHLYSLINPYESKKSASGQYINSDLKKRTLNVTLNYSD